MMREDRGRREWQLIQLDSRDRLAAGVRHGPVALDIADDLPVIVAVTFGDGQADLQAVRASIVDISEGYRRSL